VVAVFRGDGTTRFEKVYKETKKEVKGFNKIEE
jgi:hypothetical protein